MKTNTTFSNVALILMATVMTVALSACGGGGGGSDDDDSSSASDPIVSRGVITQLGSIWVNGCRYVSTSGGTYKIDDNPSASFDDYKVGMNVSIKGSKQVGSTECEADEVEYEAELEGAALGGKINGVTIIMGSTVPSGTTLTDAVRYEVSGIWIGDNALEATFVKLDDDGDGVDEIKGFVKNLGGGSFDVRGITFNGYGGVPVLSNDDFVEVHFNPATCAGSPLTCTMTSVELEDDFFDRAEGLEVEVEGAVDLSTAGCPAQADFKVDGVCVDSDSKPAQWMDGLTSIDDLVQGSRVEAEGHMIAAAPQDYLRADKVKGRGNRVRVSSLASNVNGGAGTFDLVEGNIQVSTMDGVTEFEDGLQVNGSLTSGDALDGIQVRGVRDGPTSLLALRVKLDGLSGGGDRHELRAEVDLNSVDSGAGKVSVMNIVSQGNGSTELEIDDMLFTGTLAQFLNLIDDNNDPADGSRDVLEIGFSISSGDGSNGSPYTAEEMEIEEEDD